MLKPGGSLRRSIGATIWVAGLLAACGSPGSYRTQDDETPDLIESLLSEGQDDDAFDVEAYERELEGLYADEDSEISDLLEELRAEAGPDASSEAPEAAPPARVSPENPYAEFGPRIVWYRDSGFVMKPYSFPKGMGKVAQGLLKDHGGFRVHGTPEGFGEGARFPTEPQEPDSILLHLVENYEKEAFTPPRGPNLAAPSAVPLGDWLLVTALPAELRKVERFIETFLSSVRQIEIEAKIVEVVSTKTFDYGIRPAEAGTPIFGLPNPGSLINSIDFSFANTVDAGEALFGVTAVFDGVEFNAVLEAVANEERVSIISRPKVAVREGARAEIVNITRLPYINIPVLNSNGTFTTALTFRDVGVQLYVVPHVIGDETVVLNVDIEASQQTGTAVALAQGSGDGSAVVVVPEISKRTAHTTVRLAPGQAVILGGLITERTLEREQKVPILGDIPLLGYLFKNRFEVEEKVNVLFFIRPRVLQRSELHQDF